ncbi:MAG TPA: helix-turn-helix transcriptional regulator [Verrucomicrobiae bacterium]
MALDKQQAAKLKNFGGKVRRVRVSRNVTQEQLAELADLNIRTVQKIEAGHINILLTTVLRIKESLRCDWKQLLG